MLRDLGQLREDQTPHARQAENDPTDSVFVVLLAEEVGDGVRSWNIGSIFCTLGEAQGAVRRYAEEGHRAHHGWNFAVIQEYQTGQLAPKSERHGAEHRPPAPAVVAAADASAAKIAELELEVQRLKAAQGQQTTAA